MRSALHTAAINDDADKIKTLLEAGEPADCADEQGFTPLHMAAQLNSVAAAKALLAGGASVDAANAFGNTPLFVAVFNSKGRGDLIRLLLAHGADPEHTNTSGQTPSALASLIANYDVARFFEDASG